MPFRFRRSFKIMPGWKINLSKSGISNTLGGKGFSVNFGKRGIRRTVGVPGTGISYSTQTKTPFPIQEKGRDGGQVTAKSSGCCLASLFSLPFRALAWFFAPERRKLTLIVIGAFILFCCLCTITVNVMDSLGFIPTLTPTATATSTPTASPTFTITSSPTDTPFPTSTSTPKPTRTPYLTATLPAGCLAAYPDFCISIGLPRKPCDQLPSNFTVLPPDPLGYDGDGDGLGCEN